MIPSRLFLAAGALAAIPMIVIALVLLVVGLPIWLAVVIALLVGFTGMVLLTRTAFGAVTNGLDVVQVTEADEPQLFNLLEGLVFAHGLHHPDAFVVNAEEPNAAIYGTNGSSAVLLTRGLLDSLERMELEAVLAQLLTTGRDGDLPARTVAPTYARLAPQSRENG